MPPTRNEKENYNCFLEIMNVAVCEGLREIFKQEWDKQYGATKGVWDDTCISGNELYNMEKKRPHAKPYLNAYQSGKRSEWDISALSDAILFSNALRVHLAPHVSNKVHELRVLRNNLTHKFGSQHKMPGAAFYNAYTKIKNSFKVLKLSTVNVEKIRSSSRGNYAIHLTRITYICLAIFIGVLSHYWFTNAIEAKALFRDLPTRPVHLVANRSRTVNAILQELHSLSVRNNRALTYLYISGNPGSGKSQLARLVGQRYGTNISGSWFRSSTSFFVMTVSGKSLHDVLESYVDFAERVNCEQNTTATIRDSNEATTEVKIQTLQREIAKMLRKFKGEYFWLLIVDNVVKLSEISSFLPQLEDEDWQGGQVLITTQDMSSVPSNSSLTVHISISPGMDPAESCEFLTDLSGLFENQDSVSKVAKELDYQPLALASAAFYVKKLRESKVSTQFTWKDYLKKLHEGKRNLTEMKLIEVNKPAYSLTMSAAVLLAVKMSAERDSVLKHAFTFFSYVSHEAQSLQVLVSYVLRVDKEKDKEDVGLRILQCSLILVVDDQKAVSVLLHRVVHENIQLYIGHRTNGHTKSHIPLYVFQSLLPQKCAFGGIASLIPHLKAFYARTNNLSSEVIMPGSIKMKQRMQKEIFYLTSVLIQYGEFLLSKNYLILALRMATNGDNKDNVNPEGSLHVLFPKIGDIYNNLGQIENSLGNYQQARKYMKGAVKIFSRQHGPSHKSVSKCLINLSNIICSNSKECDEKKMYSNLALHIDDSLKTKGMRYSQLGCGHYNEGDITQAEKYYLRAYHNLWKAVNVPGTDVKHTGVELAIVYMNLGILYDSLGRYEESKIYLSSSIDLFQMVTGPNHLNLADSYFNLGLVHVELSELPDAEGCFRRALEIYSEQLEPSHEKIARVSRELGVYSLNKQYGT